LYVLEDAVERNNSSLRTRLFRAGVIAMTVDMALYLCGIVTVSILAPNANAQIRAGAWFFLVGSCVALAAAVLVLFGHGWKRLPLFIAGLLALPLWYGFTLY
jgi:hypothetical protein